MPNPHPVPLSVEAGLLGRRNSILSKRAAMRLEKKLAQLGFQREMLGELVVLLKTLLSHPIGGAVVAYLLTAWLYDRNMGLAPFKLNPIDGDHVKGAIEAYIALAGAPGLIQGAVAGATALAK